MARTPARARSSLAGVAAFKRRHLTTTNAPDMLASMATTTPPEASDEALAARCDVAGMYARYASRMLAFVSSRGVAAHDLDDVAQELWVRVHNGLKARTFSGHFSGWLFQIARNLIVDRARKPAGPGELLAEDLNPDFETPQAILTRR